ncbi:MAG: hypothetical protein LUC87_04285 [Clostridiales bacterium]|nr:hypothetical protein [Clostridiales bacterium]
MIEIFTIPGNIQDREYEIQVWLPSGYHDGDELYPVMYLLDGVRAFTCRDAEGNVVSSMASFMDNWDKEMIVVCIGGPQGAGVSEREYCPFSQMQQDGTELAGKGDEAIQWILYRLKPIIDERYRTNPFRLCTAIGGYGMGGTLALYALAKYNRWFSKAACLSCDFSVGYDELSCMIANSYVDSNTRLFLSWGGDEGETRADLSKQVGCSLQLNRLFVMQECSVYPYQQRGGTYSSESWNKQIPLFMHYLWKE